MKNFGEFFNDQIQNAGCIVLSHTQFASDAKIAEAVALLKEQNPTAVIVTTAWDELDGKQLLAAMERRDTIEEELKRLAAEEHHHHDDDDDDDECDDPNCSCHHHDDDDDDEEEPEHHHHHHHHHHHADEVFTSWGVETARKYDETELRDILTALMEEKTFGVVLRAKGIVAGKDGKWFHFDYVPGEPDVRRGAADVTGRLCVIGSGIREEKLAELFGVKV